LDIVEVLSGEAQVSYCILGFAVLSNKYDVWKGTLAEGFEVGMMNKSRIPGT